MNRLPDDPEAEIMERLRGEEAEQPGAAAPSDEVVQDPDAAEPPAGPVDEEPDYATDDQNQLERQIEAPPAD